MRRTAVIQVIAALVLALVAGVLVFRFVQVNRVAQQTQQPPGVVLVVAAVDMEKGAKIRADQLKTSTFLSASAPPGGFTDAKPLVGRVLATPVTTGEVITETRLLPADATSGGVSTMIAPGMRAVAVKGNKVMGLAGFIRPGNRVDIMVTIDDETREKAKARTKVILAGIKVLATGTELRQEGDDTATSPVEVYTLEVTPEQAELLSLAASRGELHFALRNPADDLPVRTAGTDVPATLRQLQGGDNGTPRRDRGFKVEIISGTERSTMRIER